ncbi:MAG: leucyl aminopeptidase [Dehalococcoidia bacterium]|nr:MAG: leucyl aminopeptidase [Dehalococcoidia bacterium]
MEVKVVSGDITGLPLGAIIVNLFEGVKNPGGATAAVDKALGGLITQLIAEGEIKGKRNEITLIHSMGKIAPERVVVAGLGKEEEITLSVIRGVAAEACRFLRRVGATQVATIAHGAGVGGIDAEKSAQAVTEGAMLGLYTFRKHQTKEAEEGEIEQLLIVERDEEKLAALERGCAGGRIMAEATNLARDMANEPANYMTPTHMAEVAQRVADEWGFECRILEQADMERLGMGALLSVARGSRQPPKLILLNYKGGDPAKSPLGLVGKGITFDSGGISIKPSEGLGDMKGDMAGGAAVIAAMRAIGELRPKVNVTALVPATENLPDGAALKPGDIVQASNGKTIEVVTTDAEGRLILADALCYARKLGLSPVVDVATLTGACHIALGDLCTGAFGNNQELVDRVIKAGEEAGEYIWQMPMYEEYKEQNKSDIADIKNSAGRWGGAITGAQFLAEFVEETPWVHLDIAGPSHAEKDRTYLVKGATGVAVRTLANLILTHE